MGDIRALAWRHRLEPEVHAFHGRAGLEIESHPVLHTSHPTFGYEVDVGDKRIGWAPEFLELPRWTAGFDLVFADAAGWSRPIRFAHGAGGHACVLDVARDARALGVRRLVFAHIGRPTIRALDAGEKPPFGEIGYDGEVFVL